MCLAVPGKVIAIDDAGEFRTGRIDFGGVTRAACLAFVPEAAVGDYVLVHVGFAITRIDEAAAQQTLEMLQTISELETGSGGDDDAAP